jgi:hypothetical protein
LAFGAKHYFLSIAIVNEGKKRRRSFTEREKDDLGCCFEKVPYFDLLKYCAKETIG